MYIWLCLLLEKKLVVFIPKYDKMKIEKNGAFQRCPQKIFQSIDGIFGSVGCLMLVDGCCYFGRYFTCTSIWVQHCWIGKRDVFVSTSEENILIKWCYSEISFQNITKYRQYVRLCWISSNYIQWLLLCQAFWLCVVQSAKVLDRRNWVFLYQNLTK